MMEGGMHKMLLQTLKVLDASVEEYMYTVSAGRGGAGDSTYMYVAIYDIPRKLITMHDSSIAGTVRTVY